LLSHTREEERRRAAPWHWDPRHAPEAGALAPWWPATSTGTGSGAAACNLYK